MAVDVGSAGYLALILSFLSGKAREVRLLR